MEIVAIGLSVRTLKEFVQLYKLLKQFQNNPNRILSQVEGLPADAAGYTFSAPALKEREYRLDAR
ncbi:hypothetical protein KBY72_05165 [Cyanobium sp. BA5m-21]|uniref:Rpn family recombination-promoting nuclease/putative transposase n=1 Tax=unclassified Cyanobium TaxID=2627006 RepID=UPI0020CF13B2|nr:MULTISPECIES: Rpn family recombination-promoting nuclease/putative transposase [unclassified Cyanobium]MCP9903059.1 hypothetical protein [Cyanobium sp. BA5m-10]MCP9906569.1 hypothetical protein [Cyanobium sp. BA5m-21]MCP9914538.1 hypothetical protein [Cyanobium sp. BA20m-14]